MTHSWGLWRFSLIFSGITQPRFLKVHRKIKVNETAMESTAELWTQLLLIRMMQWQNPAESCTPCQALNFCQTFSGHDSVSLSALVMLHFRESTRTLLIRDSRFPYIFSEGWGYLWKLCGQCELGLSKLLLTATSHWQIHGICGLGLTLQLWCCFFSVIRSMVNDLNRRCISITTFLGNVITDSGCTHLQCSGIPDWPLLVLRQGRLIVTCEAQSHTYTLCRWPAWNAHSDSIASKSECASLEDCETYLYIYILINMASHGTNSSLSTAGICRDKMLVALYRSVWYVEAHHGSKFFVMLKIRVTRKARHHQ